jgi:hypothetical protein
VTWALGDRLPGGAPQGMTREEVEQRSELGTYISTALPSDRAGFLTVAAEGFAPDRVMDLLRALPEGETYETVNQVWAALGHNNETVRP